MLRLKKVNNNQKFEYLYIYIYVFKVFKKKKWKTSTMFPRFLTKKNRSITPVNIENIKKQISDLEKKIRLVNSIILTLLNLNQAYIKYYSTEIKDTDSSRTINAKEKFDMKTQHITDMNKDIEKNNSIIETFQKTVKDLENELTSLKQHLPNNNAGTRKYKIKKSKNRTLNSNLY